MKIINKVLYLNKKDFKENEKGNLFKKGNSIKTIYIDEFLQNIYRKDRLK